MNEKKPLKKITSGRISVTVWKRQVTAKSGAEVEVRRACIQHGRKDKETGEWNNQQIWLNIDELRDVANALDQLNEGDESPSSSIKAHGIIEYIKANSLDGGLDVFDLQEQSADEVLAQYGIRAWLHPSEKNLILNDLKAIIEQQEFAEMAYMAQHSHDSFPRASGVC